MTDVLTIRKTGDAGRDDLTKLLYLAFDRALARESHITAPALAMEGMSGKLYRMFINNLIRFLPNPRYLEVGSWSGSTACAAMDRNIATVCCIDNLSLFGGPKDHFFENTNRHRSDNVNFRFIESDFRQVDVPSINKFDVYLFDGPHEKLDNTTACSSISRHWKTTLFVLLTTGTGRLFDRARSMQSAMLVIASISL